MSQVCRVLLADDQPEVLARFRNLLRSAGHGWEVSFAGTGEEALDLLASRPYDVVVADLNMLGADGTQLLQSVMARHHSTVRGQGEGGSGSHRPCPSASTQVLRPEDADGGAAPRP